MIFDLTNLLSNAQAITVTAPSTNVIDLGDTGRVYGATADLARDIGKGVPISLLLQVVTTMTAVGAATLTVTLETDGDEAFGSAVTVWTSPAIAVASLVAGYAFNIDYVPRGVNERYFRLNYTVATGPMTAGAITAGVTMGNQTNV